MRDCLTVMIKRRMLLLMAIATITSSIGFQRAQAQHAQENELVFGSIAPLASIDPHAKFSSHAMFALKNVWEPLLTVDGDGLKPLLATSWTASEDGLTWNFDLREGVKFSDGQPFTAQAVKATFDRIQGDASLGYNYVFSNVVRTEAVDDYTVVVTLHEPESSFLFNLTTVYITPPGATEAFESVAGTGAFTIESWDKGQPLVLKANKNYWQQGYPRVERLVIRPIPEETTRLAALRAGEIDIADGLSRDSANLIAGNDDISIITAPIWQVSYLQMNVTRPPLDDPRIRKAINLAIDRALITNNVLGAGEPIASYPPKGLIGYHEGIPSNPYDPEQARALVEEALPEGQKTTLVFASRSGAYPKGEEVMQVITAELAEVGINVVPQMMESGAFLDLRTTGNYDMMYLASAAVTGDAGRYLIERILLDSYRTNYKNEQVFDLINEIASETSLARVADLNRTLQEVMLDDSPFAYIYQEEWIVGIRSNVDGFEIPPTRLSDFYNVGFKQ